MNPAINKTGFASFVNKYEIGETRFDLTMVGNSPTRTQEDLLVSLFSQAHTLTVPL